MPGAGFAGDAAVKFVLAGHDVPGCEFNEGRTQSSVDAEAILEIAHSDSQKRLLANLRALVHLVARSVALSTEPFARKLELPRERSTSMSARALHLLSAVQAA
jgi:hypothetical protein